MNSQPRTEKQQTASRENGKKSHGPRTAAGKHISSQNAFRHGFTAKTALLPGEDPAEFEAHLQIHLARFQPSDDAETLLVHTIATAAWRLRAINNQQVAVIQADMHLERDTCSARFGEESLDTEMHFAAAFTKNCGRPGSPFSTLIRYAGSIQRQHDAAVKELLALQKERRTAQRNEPANPRQPTTNQPLPSQPEPDPIPQPDILETFEITDPGGNPLHQ
jgi:hypothetical protein